MISDLINHHINVLAKSQGIKREVQKAALKRMYDYSGYPRKC